MNDKIEDRWNFKYEIAKKYFLEFKDLKVPDKFVYHKINLGNWIYLQRKAYKEKKLPLYKKEKLEQIGMIWDISIDYESIWNQYYTLAYKFKEEFGTLMIPVNYEYNGVLLGKWISYQRQRYKKNKMTLEQIQKLEKIGMIWDASNNNISTSFPEQAVFFYISKIFNNSISRYNELGFELDIYIPEINIAIEYDGFGWHQNKERDIEKNIKCDKNNIKLIRIRENGLPQMESMGDLKIFNINRGYNNLDIVIKEILIYLKVDNFDINLERDKNEIIKNYINVYKKQWNNMYEKAKLYYLNFNTLVKVKDKEIDSWLKHQRQRYWSKRSPLSKDEINKLEQIGMIWDVYKEQWEKSYNIAKQYFEENGNINVTTTFRYNNFELGNWISTQRTSYKSNKLDSGRIDKLEQIGIVWDAVPDYEALWDANYDIAKEYYIENKNLEVPIRLTYKGKRLGAWINKMRSEKDKLSDYQIRMLDEIGMVWDIFDKQWLEMYQLLVEYYNVNGNINVPFEYLINGKKLGYWLKRQCSNRQKLSEEKRKKLEILGIVWKRNTTKWDEMYQIAKDYYNEYGNLNVNTHSLYKGERLGEWINHQRTWYKRIGTKRENSNFSYECIKKLEQIGMIWNVSEQKWKEKYDIIKKYYDKNGNIDIPSSYIFDDIDIGDWLYRQKKLYQEKKLTEFQINQLEKLNVKWS